MSDYNSLRHRLLRVPASLVRWLIHMFGSITWVSLPVCLHLKKYPCWQMFRDICLWKLHSSSQGPLWFLGVLSCRLQFRGATLSPGSRPRCGQWAETRPGRPDTAAHRRMLYFLMSKQITEYLNMLTSAGRSSFRLSASSRILYLYLISHF